MQNVDVLFHHWGVSTSPDVLGNSDTGGLQTSRRNGIPFLGPLVWGWADLERRESQHVFFIRAFRCAGLSRFFGAPAASEHLPESRSAQSTPDSKPEDSKPEDSTRDSGQVWGRFGRVVHCREVPGSPMNHKVCAILRFVGYCKKQLDDTEAN